MDESWRAPIGSVVLPRRFAEQTLRRSGGSLGADDFRDVFGGPPRSVLLRQISGGDFASPPSSVSSFFNHRDRDCASGLGAPSFYEDVFRPPQHNSAVRGAQGGVWETGTKDSLCEDIFESPGGGSGHEEDRRRRLRTWSWKSTSKLKSNLSSALSWGDGVDQVSRSPRRGFIDDAVLSSFASKLRPITVPSRRRGGSPSPMTVSINGEQSSSWRTSSTAPCPRPCFRHLSSEDSVTTRRSKVDDPFRLHRPYSSPDGVVDIQQMRLTAAKDDDSIYDDIPMATIRPVRTQEQMAAIQVLAKEVRVVVEAEEEVEAESYAIEVVPARKAVDAEGLGPVEEAGRSVGEGEVRGFVVLAGIPGQGWRWAPAEIQIEAKHRHVTRRVEG